MNDEKDDALLGPEGTPRHLHRAPLPEVYRCMLGFESDGVFWRAMPQRPFLPRGLMLWGVPDGATLEQAVIGQELQVLVSASGVPAKFFAMAKSYEELAKRVDEGCEP